MRYLFVYNNARNLGGVQTLVARIARGLIEAGHSASVVFFTEVSDAVAKLFPDECACTSIPAGYADRILFPHNCGRWLSETHGDAEVCVAIGSGPLHFISANLGSFRRPPAVIEYIVADLVFTGSGRKVFGRLYSGMFLDRYFARKLPDVDKFFLSDALLRIVEEGLGTRFPEARVVPPPIATSHGSATASLRPFRIVSVGRIDSVVKTYNFSVPAIVRELRDEGLEVRWDVYGGGSPADVERFLAILREQGVEDRVTWHGEVPYAEMGAALENATVFLGMGTAALEAAMLGIPTLIAVASTSEPVCYGFAHEVPFGVLGEDGAYWLERRRIRDALGRLYRSSQEEYERLVERDRTYAKNYSAERLIARFIELTSEARSVAVPPFPRTWSALMAAHRLVRKLASSSTPAGSGGRSRPASAHDSGE